MQRKRELGDAKTPSFKKEKQALQQPQKSGEATPQQVSSSALSALAVTATATRASEIRGSAAAASSSGHPPLPGSSAVLQAASSANVPQQGLVAATGCYVMTKDMINPLVEAVSQATAEMDQAHRAYHYAQKAVYEAHVRYKQSIERVNVAHARLTEMCMGMVPPMVQVHVVNAQPALLAPSQDLQPPQPMPHPFAASANGAQQHFFAPVPMRTVGPSSSAQPPIQQQNGPQQNGPGR